MKKLLTGLFLFLTLLSCNSVDPTQFTEEALNDVFLNQYGQHIPFKAILEKHKGQTILIDVWASWCKDCLEGLPSIKKIQSENKDVVYLFLSLDKTEKQWKNGIKKHQISGEHYFITSGWDGPFNEFLKLNWIPRYLIVDKQGNIKLFKAVKANNKLIENL